MYTINQTKTRATSFPLRLNSLKHCTAVKVYMTRVRIKQSETLFLEYLLI